MLTKNSYLYIELKITGYPLSIKETQLALQFLKSKAVTRILSYYITCTFYKLNHSFKSSYNI